MLQEEFLTREHSLTENEISLHEDEMKGEQGQLNVLKKATQSSDNQVIFHSEENAEEQHMNRQDIKKNENFIRQKQESLHQCSSNRVSNSKFSPQETMRDQKEENLDQDGDKQTKSVRNNQISSHTSETHRKSMSFYFYNETNLEKIATPLNTYQLSQSNQMGYIQKDGKWHIETNWIGYTSIQRFLQSLENHQVEGFSLWLKFKNESVTPSLKRLYYDLRISPGKNIPAELVNRRVYIQNNKRYFGNGWNHSKFVHRPSKVNPVSNFQDFFLEKLDNKWFDVSPRTAKKIRENIFQQFLGKDTTFEEITKKLGSGERKRIPDLFIEKFDLEKSENSWIRAFHEYLHNLKPEYLTKTLLKFKDKFPNTLDYFLSKRYEIGLPTELKNHLMTIKLEIEQSNISIPNSFQDSFDETIKKYGNDIMFQTQNSGIYSPYLFDTIRSLGTHSKALLLNSLIAAKTNITVIDKAKTLDLSFYQPTLEINHQFPEKLRNRTFFVFKDSSYTNKKWSKVFSKKLSVPIVDLCNMIQKKKYSFTDPSTGRIVNEWLNPTSFIRKSLGIKGRSTIYVSKYNINTIESATRLVLQEKKVKNAPDVAKLTNFFKKHPTLAKATRKPELLYKEFSFLTSEINESVSKDINNLAKNKTIPQIIELFSFKDSLKSKELKKLALDLMENSKNIVENQIKRRKEWIWKWNNEMKNLETTGHRIPKKMIRGFNRRLSTKKEVLVRKTSGKYYYLEDFTELAKDIEINLIGKVSHNIAFDNYIKAINLIEKVFEFKRINNSYYAMVKRDCDTYLKCRILSKPGPAKDLWDKLAVERLRGNKSLNLVKCFTRTKLGNPAVYKLNYDIKEIKKVIYARYNEIIRTSDFNRNVARDRYGIVTVVRNKINNSHFNNYSTGIISIDEFKVFKIDLNFVLKEVKSHFEKPLHLYDGFQIYEKIMEIMLSNVKSVKLKDRTEAIINMETIRKAGFPAANSKKIDKKGHHVAWYEPYRTSWMNAVTRYIFSNKKFRKSLELFNFDEEMVTIPTGSGKGRNRKIISTVPDFVTYLRSSKSKIGEIIQVKNIGKYNPRYPVDFFRDLTKTVGWTIDGRKSCGKNVFVMKANERSKFKLNKLIDGHHIVIIANWGGHKDIDRLGEGVEAAREILQGFNSNRVKLIIERPFIGNFNRKKTIDQIQDVWKMSKGYILKGMPTRTSIKIWGKIETITQDSTNIEEFYLRVLDWLTGNDDQNGSNTKTK